LSAAADSDEQYQSLDAPMGHLRSGMGAPLASAVKDLTGYLGASGSVSQRSEPLLRAIGTPSRYGRRDLGSPRYLTGQRRAWIIEHRDHYRAAAAGRS